MTPRFSLTFQPPLESVYFFLTCSGWLFLVCHSCACLTFEKHLFNHHTEFQKHKWPCLSCILFKFSTGLSVPLLTQSINIPCPYFKRFFILIIHEHGNCVICYPTCVYVCVCVHSSVCTWFTYILWPLCSSPGATSPLCHSHTGFTSTTPHLPSPSAVTHTPD